MFYRARFDPAPEGGYVIEFPDLPWGVTQGETEEEGIFMAHDVLCIVISETMKKGLVLPIPKAHRGKQYRTIELSAQESIKVGLYNVWKQSGLTKADFSRRLGIPKSNVDRLFDLRHASRLDQLEAALKLLDKRLVCVIDDAA